MRQLITEWRRKAQDNRNPFIAKTLRDCADELEKSVHDEDHGSYFRDWCPWCDKERESEENDGHE